LEEVIEKEPGVRLIEDLAAVVGDTYVKVEGVALVTRLNGTGSDPPPSPRYEVLMADMQARGVTKPNRLLASPNTALALVIGYLPPGVQKGDRIDVQVRAPTRSRTTSLKGGCLMQTRLREMKVLGSAIHTGRVVGLAEGDILVHALMEGDEDPVSLTRGRVLGGGESLQSRSLGLALRSEHKSVRTSSMIGTAINTRFHTFDQGGVKQGVATPKRDNFIELTVHPRYRNNVARYLQVIGSISIGESASDRVGRLGILGKYLLAAQTSARAALQLEALGHEGVDVLARGIDSDNPEVRFYAAEALAYLGDERAAKPLAEAARNEPAFRWHALTALSVMDDIDALDEIADLLHVSSAETRYGAFRALRARGANAPLVRGENMAGKFNYHVIDTTSPPMIHLTWSRRPEVVLFGRDQRLSTPLVLFSGTGRQFLIKGLQGDRLRVICYMPGEPDTQSECSTRVDEVIRAVAELGGSYADVVQMLREAKEKKLLDSRVVFDALPRSGRKYYRRDHKEESDEGEDERQVASPRPNLFFTPGERPGHRPGESHRDSAGSESDSEEGGSPGAVSLLRYPSSLVFPWLNR